MDSALLVGINAYPSPNVLHGCLNDIKDVESELVSVHRFDRSNIVTLEDGAATADAIKKALAAAVAKVKKKGDRFVFWYSGHGAQLIEGQISSDVICPVDFAFTKETSVTVSDFHAIFSKLPSGAVAVWGSDSCHSGDLERDLRFMGVPKLFRPPPGAMALAGYALNRGLNTTKSTPIRDAVSGLPSIVLFAGCRSNQTSADAFIEGRYNGAFTYYFLKALGRPGGLQESLVRLAEDTHALLEQNHYSQVPQVSGSGTLTARAFMQT